MKQDQSPSSGIATTTRLPPELERVIFERVAYENLRQAAIITLVARRAYEWWVLLQCIACQLMLMRYKIRITPVLYRVFSIHSAEGVTTPPLVLYRTLQDPSVDGNPDWIPIDPSEVKDGLDDVQRFGYPNSQIVTHTNLTPLKKFGTYIRHALFQGRSTYDIARIVRLCPNIQNLAIWVPWGGEAVKIVLPDLRRLQPRRLSFDAASFFFGASNLELYPYPLNQAPFLSVTHLQLVNFVWREGAWRELALFPRLTHIALTGLSHSIERITHVANEILSTCTLLELLIVYYFEGDSTFDRLGEDTQLELRVDSPERLVIMKRQLEVIPSWLRSAYGDDNMWLQGEKRKDGARVIPLE